MTREDHDGVVTLRGDGSIDQVLRRAVRLIEALGLDVLAVIDHSGDAAEAGLVLPETKLVLFGNPKVLTELMVARPPLAIELPLKLLIWENDTSQVFVGYIAAEALGSRQRPLRTFAPHLFRDDRLGPRHHSLPCVGHISLRCIGHVIFLGGHFLDRCSLTRRTLPGRAQEAGDDDPRR